MAEDDDIKQDPKDQRQLDFDPETPPWLQPAVDEEEGAGGWSLGAGTMGAIAVILVAGFLGALIYVQRDDPDAPPRIVSAPTTAIRVKPEAPGGMEVAHQDKEVLNSPGVDPDADTLAPPAEQPVAALDRVIAAQDASRAEDAGADAAEAADAATSSPVSSSSSPASAPRNAAVQSTVQSATSAGPAADQQLQPAQSSTIQSSPAKTVSEAASATVLPPEGPVFRVQLGAFGSRDSAAAAWQRARTSAGAALRGLEPSYETVQLSDRSLIRLRTGAFAKRSGADGLCTALKDQGLPCLIVKP